MFNNVRASENHVVHNSCLWSEEAAERGGVMITTTVSVMRKMNVMVTSTKTEKATYQRKRVLKQRFLPLPT